MGNQLDELVSAHYGWSGLMEAIADEIRGKGIDPEHERPDPLAEEAGPRAELDSGLLNGPDGPEMGKNVGRNSREGRILPVIGVFERL